jgi:PEGA domain
MNAPVPTAHDGFGNRTNGIDSETGDEVELLDLSAELLEHSGFVAALGERVARFATVRHTSYVHLRRLDRPSADRLELVSDHTPGWRLSELLSESHGAGIPIDISIVIGVMRQLLPAVALYSRHNREAAIGALAVERLIVTPQGRLVIAEHAFGPALEKLNLGRDKLWRQLRVAMPQSAGLPRSNQRSDAHAVGVVAVSLLLGRPLALEEFPARLQSLVETAQEFRDGQPKPLSAPFASWLTRALQFDVRTAFHAPSDAQLAFEAVLASDRTYVTTSAKLEAWVADIGARIDDRRRPKPDPEVLRQQELEREQELERQREEERQRELERQREAEREQERERELVRLRELERERAEELARLREQERQRALEVEQLREQEREREGQRQREREQERQREQERELPVVAPPPVESAPVPLEAEVMAPATPSRSPLMYGLGALVLLLLLAVGWLATRDTSGGMREGEGELAVQSRPQGARVVVDGQERGVTPLTLRLNSGAHVLEVQVGKSEPRVIPLTIQAGVQTSQYIELQGVTATGTLEIRSEPNGARVTIDGQPRGTTPATVRDLAAGQHTVVLEVGGRKATQTVKIEAGSTAQLVVPLPRR